MASSVLIVDGDGASAAALADELGAQGIAVRVTTNGKEALEWIGERRPDVVVVCVQLDTMSGYSLCARLKKDPELRSLPVVMTSADPQTIEGFLQHKRVATRADLYLEKPVRAETLIETFALKRENVAVPTTRDLFADEVEALKAELRAKDDRIRELENLLTRANARLAAIDLDDSHSEPL